MKKLLLSTLSLSLLSAVNLAHAQSSVTLYGAIDTSIGVVHGNNGKGNNMFTVGSGDLTAPIIGVKGNEQLNTDLSAIFQAEMQYNSSNGQFSPGNNNRLFNRVAFVGLQSKQYGTVTLGRQFDPSVDMVQPLTADGIYGTHFATPGDVDNNDNTAGFNNAIKYTSPSINGLQFAAMYAFSNIAGKNGQGQSWGGAASYNFNDFTVAASYLSMNSPADGMRNNWNSPSSDGNFPGSINSGYITAKNVSIAQVASQYVAGPFTFGLGYSNARYRHDQFSLFSTNENFNTGRAFVGYQATPAITLAAGYDFTKASGDTSATYNEFSLASIYALSKQTKVYLIGEYQNASGTQRVMDGQGTSLQPAHASLGSSGLIGAGNQAYLGAGISHSF